MEQTLLAWGRYNLRFTIRDARFAIHDSRCKIHRRHDEIRDLFAKLLKDILTVFFIFFSKYFLFAYPKEFSESFLKNITYFFSIFRKFEKIGINVYH